MKKVGKTLTPRLPEIARKKLKQGGKHNNKKAYKRKEKYKKNTADETARPYFFEWYNLSFDEHNGCFNIWTFLAVLSEYQSNEKRMVQ